jgi:hypothetical protein
VICLIVKTKRERTWLNVEKKQKKLRRKKLRKEEEDS